jgi:hypothetical protein
MNGLDIAAGVAGYTFSATGADIAMKQLKSNIRREKEAMRGIE